MIRRNWRQGEGPEARLKDDVSTSTKRHYQGGLHYCRKSYEKIRRWNCWKNSKNDFDGLIWSLYVRFTYEQIRIKNKLIVCQIVDQWPLTFPWPLVNNSDDEWISTFKYCINCAGIYTVLNLSVQQVPIWAISYRFTYIDQSLVNHWSIIGHYLIILGHFWVKYWRILTINWSSSCQLLINIEYYCFEVLSYC